MDKNIIKKHLSQKFVTEAKGETATPGITVTNAAKKQSEKFNKEGVKDIDKNLSSYEGSLKKGMETTKVPNKFNYNDKSEEEYHDMMEIENGQEMIEYDRINKGFKDRAKQALEGSQEMGNKGGKDMGNAEAAWGASSDDFGKKKYESAKKSAELRADSTDDLLSFGDVIMKNPNPSKNMRKHSAYANESKDNNKPQIKESMKRLNFKKEFNGVGNALKMIPESYKVNNKTFEMTDGVENYKIRWEGNLTEGKAVVLMASDKTMVNEDMAHMKHLMGYKSNETLGLVKGKARLDENKMFTDIWSKTRDLMEAEDIESAKAKTGNLEDIKKKAPEATKHVQGSVSKDKGTKAPAAKEGDLDDAVSHAPEAKKHVEGSVSTEKGTKAPAPKKGEWEGVKKKAAEATKHVTMKESFQAEEEEEEEVDDVTTEEVEETKMVKTEGENIEGKKTKAGHWDEISVPHAAEAKKHVHMGKAGMNEGVQLGENFFAPLSEEMDDYEVKEGMDMMSYPGDFTKDAGKLVSDIGSKIGQKLSSLSLRALKMTEEDVKKIGDYMMEVFGTTTPELNKENAEKFVKSLGLSNLSEGEMGTFKDDESILIKMLARIKQILGLNQYAWVGLPLSALMAGLNPANSGSAFAITLIGGWVLLGLFSKILSLFGYNQDGDVAGYGHYDADTDIRNK